jgi:hypothetical protein
MTIVSLGQLPLRQLHIGFFVNHYISTISANRVQNAQTFVDAGRRISTHAVIIDAKQKAAVVNPAA